MDEIITEGSKTVVAKKLAPAVKDQLQCPDNSAQLKDAKERSYPPLKPKEMSG